MIDWLKRKLMVAAGLFLIAAMLLMCDFGIDDQIEVDNAYCSGVAEKLWPEYKKQLGVNCE